MKKKLGMIISTIVYLLAGALVAIVCIIPFGEDTQFPIYLFISLLFFYFTFFLELIIHEYGHYLFGKLTGYELISFRIFNRILVKKDQKYIWKKFSLAGTGGQCLMLPPQSNACILYNLGGVILNGITGMICILIAYFTNGLVYSFFACFAISAFSLVLTNGIPLTIGNIPNDGMNVVHLVKNGYHNEAFFKQMYISYEQTHGKRLRELPDEYFEYDNTKLDNPLESTIAVFECNRLFDQREFDACQTMIKELLEINSIPAIYRFLLMNDLNTIHYLKNEPVETSKELLKFNKTMKNHPAMIRCNIVYALVKHESIDPYIKQFEKITDSYPYEGDLDSEKEMIDIILQNQ